ncbi:hypothetical protein LTR05_004261 [Lithohypha guttulata]|uniref:Peptidase metallopeptidase domain-containing protein n=1 Tax=Lithohypha guttulata TaxID=1690604 RepID=A0AAN7YBP3_9EURO|nr:hypothetical protein LTR05_004261 [Lithohypha guttulata]
MPTGTFEDYFVCFELPPPQDARLDAFSQALNENPRNAVLSSGPLIDPSMGSAPDEASPFILSNDEPAALALNGGKLWEPGRTLTIRFLEGSPKLQKRVRDQATTWLDYANIRFNWIDTGPADIRISFKQGGGSWSHVGVECSQVADPLPTMNFGKMDETTSIEDVRRVVLHEFGHALGCIHEHQSPLSSLEWNTARVYADCARPPNKWPKNVVDYNILDKTRNDQIKTREFDLDSIMLYSYPATWLVNGKGTKNNTSLSKEDKAWITHCYPAYQTDVGFFSTMEVREWNNPDTSNDYKQVAFTPSYEKVPQILMGLTWLDLDHQHNLSIKAGASDISADGCRVSITSAADSRVYTGGCAWLESVDEEYDLQIGEVDVTSMATLPAQGSLKKDIKFDSPFAEKKPPTVLVWFKSLGLDKDGAWNIKVSAKNAHFGGFQLVVDVGEGTILQAAEVSWVAFAANRDDVASGMVSTPGFSKAPYVQLPNENAGKVDFTEGVFSEIPQTLVAISGLHFEKGHNLRLRLSQSSLSVNGFVWHMDNWLDTVMFGASMTWLAMKPGAKRPWAE